MGWKPKAADLGHEIEVSGKVAAVKTGQLNGHAAAAAEAREHEEPLQGAAAVAEVLRLLLCEDPAGVAIWQYVKAFVVAQVLFELVNFYLNTSVFYWIGRAIEHKDPDAFQAWVPYLALIVPKAAADLVSRSCKWKVRKGWRISIMMRLCRALLDTEEEPDAHVIYRLRFTDGTSTPENQITEDGRLFGDMLHELLMPVVGHAVHLLLVSCHLLTINRIFFLRALVAMPFTAVLNFVVAATLMSSLMIKVETISATLRSFVGRVREHVESVALFRGGPSELQRYKGAHASLAYTKARVVFSFAVCATVNDTLGAAMLLVPLWCLVNDVLYGRIDVNDALTAYYGVEGFRHSAITLITQPQVLIQAGVPAARILQLLSEADCLRAEASRRRLSTAENVLSLERRSTREGPVLELCDVALWTPTRKGIAPQVLLQGLSLRLSAGDSLLVVGETGAGKTALLAAVHGLWSTGRGRVSRCVDSAVFCVPQQPYMFQGTLRDQMLYPHLDREDVSDSALWKVLEQVNLLQDLKSYRLVDTCPWGDLLSLGQQQRIGIARALLAREVRLMVLDDCTSALDTWNEQGVYAAVHKRVPCYISAGHKPALRQYHTHTLCLKPSAPHAWSLLPAADGDAKAAVSSALKRATEDAPALVALPSTVDARVRGVLPPADLVSFIRCGVNVARPVIFQQSRQRWLAMFMAAALATMFLSGSLAAYFLPLSQEFLERLTVRDVDRVWDFIARRIWYFPAKWALLFAVTYTVGSVAISLTEALRLGLVQRYLGCGSAGLYLLHTAGSEENPSDQISDICGFDCDIVGQSGIYFSLSLLNMLFGIVMAGIALWKNEPLVGQVLTACMLVVGSAVYYWLVRPSMQIFMVFLERNTALRSSVAHAYIHAHAVSFLRGGPAELTRIEDMGNAALDASFSYLYYVNFFKGVDYLVDFALQVVRIFITGPRTLGGLMTTSQAHVLAMQMRGLSSQVNDILQMICSSAPVFSVSSRIQAFIAAIDSVEAAALQGTEGIVLQEGPSLELEDVLLKTPRNALGIASLAVLQVPSAQLPVGASMLVAGESGLGKSSLLRALAGLWSNGGGVVRRPSADATFFVSQRPYLCLGSLREQLLYPGGGTKPTTAQLREVVKSVGLDHLLTSPGLEEEEDLSIRTERPFAAFDEVEAAMHWTGRLSQGEVQRVSFARVLLRKGLELVLLDEGTAAMDTSHEAEMYRLLGAHVPSYVSVAHRQQLRRFHTHVLALERRDGPAATRFLCMAEYERELRV